ncbi:MAG: hypothetical protein V4618_13505 [Pseudomonadota bacterium]
MAMFGQQPRPQSPLDILMQQQAGSGRAPWMTPGIGDGMGQGDIDMSIPEDPYAGERPNKPGFFAKGGGWKDVLGEGLGALSQQLGGSNPYAQGRDRQHEEALIRLRGEQDAAADTRRQAQRDSEVNIFGNGDDGFYGYSKEGGVNPLLPGTGPKEDAVITRLRAAGIDPNSPEGKQAIMMSLPGYGYSSEVFGRKQTLKAATPGKAPGSGGGGSGTVKSTRVVNGKAYYKVNGEWYDNPEGR